MKSDQMWDPLEYMSGYPQTMSNAQKKIITNILVSYNGYFDPFSELIQNALDAVDKRKEISKNFDPYIEIIIDLSKNSITVSDNGIGFTPEEFHQFWSPNISFKNQTSRGNKGVGATYLAYSFDHLEVGTVKDNETSYAIFKGGNLWANTNSHNDPPLVHKIPPPADFQIKQGTRFIIKFGTDDKKSKQLSWYGADTPDQWEFLLRVKTPLGGIFLDEKKPNVRCTITVINKDGKSISKEISDCSYYYPHLTGTQPNKDFIHWNKVLEKESQLRANNKDVHVHFPRVGKYKGIYGEFTYEDIKNDKLGNLRHLKLTSEQHELLKIVKPKIYCFFSISAKLWEHIHDRELRDGGFKLRLNAPQILTGGLQMAMSHMPQGEILAIPLTSSIGYQKSSHVIVEMDNAKIDLGRKSFQADVRQLALDLSRSVVSMMARRRYLIRSEPAEILPSKNLHDWKNSQERHANQHPLSINNKDVFSLIDKLPTIAEPQTEQDVVVLFNHLLASGIIRNLEIYNTSTHDQYDSLCQITKTSKIDYLKFDKQNNPLGLEKDEIPDSAPMILEYKLSFDSLLDDFDNKEKTDNDIGVVVCWKMGDKWKEYYNIMPLLHPDHKESRAYHGETHRATQQSGSMTLSIIVLSELIDYINSPEKSTYYQSEKYLKN